LPRATAAALLPAALLPSAPLPTPPLACPPACLTCLTRLAPPPPPPPLQGLVGDSFGQLGERAEAVARLCGETSEGLATCFEAPLKEFVRTVGAVKKVMADRGAALAAYQQVGAGRGWGWGHGCGVGRGWARPGQLFGVF